MCVKCELVVLYLCEIRIINKPFLLCWFSSSFTHFSHKLFELTAKSLTPPPYPLNSINCNWFRFDRTLPPSKPDFSGSLKFAFRRSIVLSSSPPIDALCEKGIVTERTLLCAFFFLPNKFPVRFAITTSNDFLLCPTFLICSALASSSDWDKGKVKCNKLVDWIRGRARARHGRKWNWVRRLLECCRRVIIVIAETTK